MTEPAGKKKLKDRENINETINKLQLMSKYWTLHPTIRRHIFFSSTWATFTKVEYALSYTEILNQYNWINITLAMFFDQKAVKSEVDIQKHSREKAMYLELKSFWVSVQTKLCESAFLTSPPGNHKKAIRRTKPFCKLHFFSPQWN